METTAEPPQTVTTPRKPRAKHNRPRVDYGLALALKAKGYTYPMIAEELGCQVNTLKVYFSRTGLVEKLATAKEKALAKDVQDGSDKAKQALATEIVEQIQGLREQPLVAAGLGNTPFGQGRATIAKTIAETAKIVFGWGSEAPTSQALTLLCLSSTDSLQQGLARPIEVESTVQPGLPQPAQVEQNPQQIQAVQDIAPASTEQAS